MVTCRKCLSDTFPENELSTEMGAYAFGLSTDESAR